MAKINIFKHNIRGWYRLTAIDKTKARYRMIFGQKSNGKTFAILEKCLREYIEKGRQSFYIRRYAEDLRTKLIGTLFKKGNLQDMLKKTEWDFVDYFNGGFYLAKLDEKGRTIREPEPFMFTAALNNATHVSGTRFPSENIYYIFFDEFLTRGYYLVNEWNVFTHMISDIVRQYDIATIYMVGNTVSWDCPYFREMNIFKAETMQIGEVRVYDHGQGTTIAVEYADGSGLHLDSKVYFAGFDNPALRMITKGEWEIPSYPHLPEEYYKHINHGNVFIRYGNKIVHGDLFEYKKTFAIYFHDKSSPITLGKNDIVLGEDVLEFLPQCEYNLMNPTTKYGKMILQAFNEGRVFYQDNFIGEYVNNYLKYCKQMTLVK